MDGTIGQGGHTGYILSNLSPRGKIIGIDKIVLILTIALIYIFNSFNLLFEDN